ncbi:MAG: gephyrin-like molybdotransferase Glp [Terracidiphilus sp.]
MSSSALLSYTEAASLVAAYSAKLMRRRSAALPSTERAELGCASGRVLAQPLLADRDQPPFARSTRDGYACRAAEANAHQPLAVAGASRAGDPPAGSLPPKALWEIMTGAPVPPDADAVIMFEHVEVGKSKKRRSIRLITPRTLMPGDNIVAQGAQGHAGDELLPAGVTIHSGQIALAAACGYSTLDVFLRPRVAILATGDELVPVDASPAPGQIRNSNAPMLAAMVADAGGEPWVLPTAGDNAKALDDVLAQALEAELLLISGGVSAGKFDLVEPALARMKARFHFTGVRMQPGKPTVFGELSRKGKIDSRPKTLPFFGLPGNPVASAVTFLLFAAPVLGALAGSRESRPRLALAKLAPPVVREAKAGLTRFLPAFCDFGAAAGEAPQAAFVPWHGSGDLTALARSNCFIVVPEDARGLRHGSNVRMLLL